MDKHYKCLSCGTTLPKNTGNIFKTCECGNLSVKGDSLSSMVVSPKSNYEMVAPVPDQTVYKILQKSTGLYYKPKKWPSKTNFSVNGKIYQRKPNLKRVLSLPGNCVIETFKLSSK